MLIRKVEQGSLRTHVFSCSTLDLYYMCVLFMFESGIYIFLLNYYMSYMLHMQVKQHNNNQYANNGVYRIKCKDTPLQYIFQKGCSFKTQFNEHIRTIKYNKNTLTNAQHTTHTGRTCGNMHETVEIAQVARNGRHMNNIEKYHIFVYQKNK
jgi:hypothetical protein